MEVLANEAMMVMIMAVVMIMVVVMIMTVVMMMAKVVMLMLYDADDGTGDK